MLSRVEQFGQDQVEAASDLGPGAERSTKAGRRRLCALHRYDERAATISLVNQISIFVFEQHALLHRDGFQLAGANSEKRARFFRRSFVVQNPEGRVVSLGGPQSHLSWVRVFFPALRAECVSEECALVTALEAVGAGLLFVARPGREVIARS